MPPTRRGGGLLKTWGRYCSQAAESSGMDGLTVMKLYHDKWLRLSGTETHDRLPLCVLEGHIARRSNWTKS